MTQKSLNWVLEYTSVANKSDVFIFFRTSLVQTDEMQSMGNLEGLRAQSKSFFSGSFSALWKKYYLEPKTERF